MVLECGLKFCAQDREDWQDDVNMGVTSGFSKYCALILEQYVCVE
jgi:hypothetical protein